MKKTLSIVLVAVMLFSLASSSFAVLSPKTDIPAAAADTRNSAVNDILGKLFTDGRGVITNDEFIKMALMGGLRFTPDERWGGNAFMFFAPYREMIAVVGADTDPNEFDFNAWIESLGVNSKYVASNLLEVRNNEDGTKELVFGVALNDEFNEGFDVYNTITSIEYLYLFATVLSSAKYAFEYRGIMMSTRGIYSQTALFMQDVNYDGEVTAKDIKALKQSIAGFNVLINPIAADQNGDGEVTAKDLKALKLVIAN